MPMATADDGAGIDHEATGTGSMPRLRGLDQSHALDRVSPT